MAGRTNVFLSKALEFADDVVGSSSRKLQNQASVLSKAQVSGLSARRAHRLAEVAGGRSARARVRLGLGAGSGAIAAGVMSHHNRMKREHRALDQIAQMYQGQSDEQNGFNDSNNAGTTDVYE